MSRRSEEDVYQVVRQIKVFVIVSIVGLLGLTLLVIVLDRTTETFEQVARYRPPVESAHEGQGTPSESIINQVHGQLVYVPAYSHIYHKDGSPTLLTITLSIRNTSLNHPIVIDSVRYFDTTGKEVKSYLKKPIRLAPLATTEFLVERDDTSGGSGANFLVQWAAENFVSAPVIEAVMIDTEIQQGISFVRSGTVIEEIGSEKK